MVSIQHPLFLHVLQCGFTVGEETHSLGASHVVAANHSKYAEVNKLVIVYFPNPALRLFQDW